VQGDLPKEEMEEAGANIPPIKVYPDKFKGQVVVVTGAAQGIGEATAKLFAAQGASVVLADINKEKVEETSTKLTQNGTTTARACNIGVEEEVDALVKGIISDPKLRKIDVLVHLAGIYPFHSINEYPTSQYRRVMNVNMDGCFFLNRAVLPHMQKAGYGRIINTASNAVYSPVPGLSAYAGAKGAITAFTRTLAAEAGPGVTANVVAPGLTLTPTTSNQSPALFDQIIAIQCVKRYGRPEDIAHTISFIASPEAQMITGQVFDVSGGATFH
jgi:NAD(P)-dependent dehydrogenase (short-subunit alcohol dehydrogenase family)